jgi:hypothetical protein
VGRWIEIHYWSQRQPWEEIVPLTKAADHLKAMGDFEYLYLMGHGTVDNYATVPAGFLAEQLIEMGLKQDIRGIWLLSCKAGESFVQQLYSALKGKWSVQGYTGETAIDTTGKMMVIDPQKNTEELAAEYKQARKNAAGVEAEALKFIQQSYKVGMPTKDIKRIARTVAEMTQEAYGPIHEINERVRSTDWSFVSYGAEQDFLPASEVNVLAQFENV